MSEKSVIIIGAGTVGTLAAIYLKRSGFEVTLVESAEDILSGASTVANIAHYSGSEYPKDSTGQTGRDCVLGGVFAKQFLPDSIYTPFSTSNDLRFLVSARAHESGDLTLERFREHASDMRDYYATLFSRVASVRNWSAEETAMRLNGLPADFIRDLNQSELGGAEGIKGGHFAAGRGVNVSAYASLIRSQLEECGVTVLTGTKLTRIELQDGKYRVSLEGECDSLQADQVVLTASYRNADVSSIIKSQRKPLSFWCFLNLMTYVSIPKGSPEDIYNIYFTLIEENGGMFAPLRRATEYEDGLAALYWPCNQGSQFDSFVVRAGEELHVPEVWDDYCREGFEEANERGDEIRRSLAKFYPWLNDCELQRVSARCVVKPIPDATVKPQDIDLKFERHCRPSDHPIEYCPGVFGIVGTKWTNSITAAIELVRSVKWRSLKNNHDHDQIDAREFEANLNLEDILENDSDLFSLADQAVEITANDLKDFSRDLPYQSLKKEIDFNWNASPAAFH